MDMVTEMWQRVSSRLTPLQQLNQNRWRSRQVSSQKNQYEKKERKKQGTASTTNQSAFGCIKTLWEKATAMLFPYPRPKVLQPSSARADAG